MNIKIANKLVELRKKNGLSQEELADKLGLSRQAVSKWERAESSPDTDNLICLAKLYNVSLDDLLNTDETLEEISREVKEKEEEKKGKAVELTEEEKARNRKFKMIEGIVSGSALLVATIIYLTVSILNNTEWHRLWIVYFIAIIAPSIVSGIKHHRFTEFNYPILAVLAFFILGFYADMWNPGWVVFLTIPVFYSIFGPIDHAYKEKHGKAYDDDNDEDDDDEE